jgi:hypothetical protein
MTPQAAGTAGPVALSHVGTDVAPSTSSRCESLSLAATAWSVNDLAVVTAAFPVFI